VRQWMREQSKPLLGALLLIDLAFVALHVATDGGRGPITSLDTDRGLGGLWGFGQAMLAAVLVYEIFRSTRLTVYAAWAATFVIVGLDDLLEIHENGGLKVSEAFELPEVAGLRGQDLGELIPLLIAIAVTVRNADSRGRRDTVTFFVLMAALVFFAAGLDALHMAGTDDITTMWDVTPAGVIEDGGELVMLSLLASSAFAARRVRQSPVADAAGVVESPVSG
jgi:hypothetical protein